ncbi:hypothetical protein [Ilumatobacter sp.]|uniref:hypothetical protein n=1 Tax=Ilumatobacter sp. TaxID=1967498 RepID=UPI003B517439
MRHPALKILAIAATIATASCAGSDDEATDATAPATAATVTGATVADTAPAADDTASDAPVDTEPGTSDPADPEPSGDGSTGSMEGVAPEDAEFCAALEDLADSVSTADPDSVITAFETLDETAPDAIADDTARLLEFAERGLEISSLPPDEQADAIDEFADLEGEFDEATADVEDFARERCSNLSDDFFGEG